MVDYRPIANFANVTSELAPVCIFGKPGTGKSWTLKQIIHDAKQAGMSVILIDIPNKDFEDIEARKITATAAISRRFKSGRIYRIVLDKDPRSRQFSIQRVFEHLDTLAFKGMLKDFVIAIDEGNELKEIKEVYDFLIESRKFVTKAIIVSADAQPYEKICVLMKPVPFEKVEAKVLPTPSPSVVAPSLELPAQERVEVG
ncbi:MAG: ATP-binding protein [Thaumarchaeota archaeon]|nr:ATP-binding protein [Nitrososphaerota archaeon]